MYRLSRLEFFNLRHHIKLYSWNQYYQPVWSVSGTKNDKRRGNAHSVGSTLLWKAYCRVENKDWRGIFFFLWCRIWNEEWTLESKINRKCHWSPLWNSYRILFWRKWRNMRSKMSSHRAICHKQFRRYCVLKEVRAGRIWLRYEKFEIWCFGNQLN